MEVVAIVPAADSNRYSPKGDLVEWGYTTLLEWKISQLKAVAEISRICVSTSSDTVVARAQAAGVEVLKRPADLELSGVFRHAAAALPSASHLLWANPTSPFVGARVFSALIADYREAGCPDDGEVTVRITRDYMYVENEPLGFAKVSHAVSRTSLPEVKVLTNGAYIAPASNVLSRGRVFGAAPRFMEVDWLAALEIRETVQMDIFGSLIAKYFEVES